jgi:quercetin dioxygenase-like cupin family protein
MSANRRDGCKIGTVFEVKKEIPGMRQRLGCTRILGLACGLLLSGTAMAQELSKVDTRHVVVKLDNDTLQVTEVTLKPGEKLPLHTHPAYTLYTIHGGTVRIVYQGGKTEDAVWDHGDVLYGDPEGPHTTENVGKTTIKILLVEVKGPIATKKK